MERIDPRRRAVIFEARRWVGTPFRHQGAVLGAGCDCIGLVRGVGEAAGVLALAPAAWRAFSGYGRIPRPDVMHAAMLTFFRRVPPSKARLGDICWLAWREELPMHLALLSRDRRGRLTVIHALAGMRQVVEHGLTAEWRGRVHSWWRYPGLMAGAGPSPLEGEGGCGAAGRGGGPPSSSTAAAPSSVRSADSFPLQGGSGRALACGER